MCSFGSGCPEEFTQGKKEDTQGVLVLALPHILHHNKTRENLHIHALHWGASFNDFTDILTYITICTRVLIFKEIVRCAVAELITKNFPF